MPSSFARGASAGITIVAGIPSLFAAQAIPCAWLPLEKATTPRARDSASKAVNRCQAPRILNAPIGCRDSALKATFIPLISCT